MGAKGRQGPGSRAPFEQTFPPFASRAEASRRKVKHMRIQDVSLEFNPKHPCPVCGLETALAEIEPHPLHVNFEIHGYFCERCGPIKSLVVRSGRSRKKH
jgi:hypothetical protein